MLVVYGYCRVSTEEQDLTRQINDIKKVHENAIFFTETISTRKQERQIYEYIQQMQEKSMLVVTELSRLGRSIGEIYDILEKLKRKKITLKILSPQQVELKDDFNTDVMIFAFSLAARIERDLISERTKSALKAKQAMGIRVGRPRNSLKLNKLNDEQKKQIEKMLKARASISFIARMLNVHRATVKKYLENKKQGVKI